MELGLSLGLGRREEEEDEEDERSSAEPPVQLSLLPFAPVPRPQLVGFPWATANKDLSRGLDVNLIPSSLSEAEDGTPGAVSGSPNSAVSSFNVDFYSSTVAAGAAAAASGDVDGERASSRASDEEDNGNARKKLRLSKEQSAFLEESFKEHNTLNPKQKVALAKQLNLRPRQVEVWFQNRRARTKLKQTEVDCEYLKRCCETLTEENRRLQKELSELRALKTQPHPFYMQLPATTLSMCPSCEKTTTTTTITTAAAAATATATNTSANSNKGSTSTSFGALFAAKNRFYPFAHHPATSPAS